MGANGLGAPPESGATAHACEYRVGWSPGVHGRSSPSLSNANGDNNAMLLVCAVMRALLSSEAAFSPPLQGIDFSKVPSMEGGFSTAGMKQEEIVNLGFRELVLGAFAQVQVADGGGAAAKRQKK